MSVSLLQQMYQKLIWPPLYRLDAEDAHHLILRLMETVAFCPAVPALLRRFSAPPTPILEQTLFGQYFDAPIGLAAGLDKNAQAVAAFWGLGFGFLEVGTVTPLAQAGNPRPRLFRLPSDEALINRMGFNNAGAASMLARLEQLPTPHLAPLWVNIGKNKTTPNEEATEDYLRCVRILQSIAHAFVVNVSSPNTPGLRALQAADELQQLLQAVTDEVEQGRVRHLNRPPVLVKLAPDLHPADFEASVNAAQQANVSGIIISNTTLSRDNLTHHRKNETGGLSGRPLMQRSTNLIRDAYRQTQGKLPIVGVGGVFHAEHVYSKLKAGASLVEIYSALIYKGPALVYDLRQQLAELLHRDGVQHVSEVIGTEAD